MISATIPFLGWTEKVRELRNLNFSYQQLFGLVEFAILEIRRADKLTDEHVGLSRMVHETFLRIHALDELEPDEALRDREDEKVRKAFPDDYIWDRF